MGSTNLISPQYFAVLRILLPQGRIWSDAENSKGAHVAVINRTLARRYFPNGDAIGHSLRMPGYGVVAAKYWSFLVADCRHRRRRAQ